MTTDATPGALGSNEGLGPLPERKSIAERKADAAALIAVAREAGMAVQADDFGRGTYLFSSVDVLERLLDSAQSTAVAAEREPANVVFRALLLAAWDAPGTRTAGEMRAAAVTLFGAEAVDAALARMRA